MAAPLRIAPKFIEIFRDEPRRLKLWHVSSGRYRVEKIYPIAVGAIGYETPAGRWFIDKKFRDPSWLAPHSDWVPPDLRGKTLPYGHPDNPLRGAFLRLSEADGVGIHGTDKLDSLGQMASRGCIRMDPGHIMDLYRRAPTGALVLID